MHRLVAPLGRFLLALAALTTFASLSSCSESDDRPLVLVQSPVAPGTSPASVGRVDVKVTLPNGQVVVQSFTGEEAAKGNLGIYLPGGTSGSVAVEVVVYDTAGNPIATSPAVSVTVSPGKAQPTSVWSSGGDASVDSNVSEPDGPVAGLDAGIDGPHGADVLLPGEVGIDVGATGADARADVLLPDAPLGSDAPVSPDVVLPVDLTVDLEPASPDVGTDTATAIPVWRQAENVEKDQLSKSSYPVVAVDRSSQDVYVAWEEPATLKVKRFNYETQSWEATKTLEGRGTGSGLSLGVDGKGNVIAVWSRSSNTDSDETVYGVWSSTSADGVSWSPPYHINTGNTWAVNLAVAPNGTARVVYSMRTTTNVDPLYSAYYDGVGWTNNPTPIHDPQNPYGFNPRLVVDASGDGYLLFDMDDSEGYTSVGAAILTGKTGVSTPVILDGLTTAGVYYRDIVLNKKGTVVAVWGEYGNSNTTLKSKTYNPTNGWATSASTIGAVESAYSLVAALDESDNMTLAWQQRLASGRYNTLSLRGKVNGAWGEITPLETDNTAGDLTKEDSAPQLAVDGSGNVLVVWRKEIDGPDSDNSSNATRTYAIYGSAFRNGEWQTPVSIYQKTSVVSMWPSLAVSDQGFGAVAFFAWSNTSTDPDLNNTMVGFYR